jgi:hypothetical protein
MSFGDWLDSEHLSPDQRKRIDSAKKADVSPRTVDKEQCTGVFDGSGKNPYLVTLDTCTCGDFTRRGLPCKHIYRLAMECGEMEGSFETGKNKNEGIANQITFAKAVAELEKLDDECQYFVKDFLYGNLYHQTNDLDIFVDAEVEPLSTCALMTWEVLSAEATLQSFRKKDIEYILLKNSLSFNKGLKKDDLIAFCVEKISNINDFFPQKASLTFSQNFEKAKRRVYSYLLRKYDWDSYYNEDMQEFVYPHGAKFGDSSECYFPNDEITNLLDLYGHNRCKDGFVPIERENCDFEIRP